MATRKKTHIKIRRNKIWRTLLTFLRVLIGSVINFIFSLIWDKRKEDVPDRKKYSSLADSAAELARKVSPTINAAVEDNLSAAFEEAKDVYRKVAAGFSEDRQTFN